MDPQRTLGMTPWVRRLVAANLAVFLLQQTVFVDPRFLAAFGFVPLRALAQPWTFLTYMFLHASFLHLAFNLLALFVFGPSVEERMGGGRFLAYYLLCGLGGAVLSFALMQLRPVDLVVGASAAVYGVMLAFAWAWPDQPIYVFSFPAPIPAKWLVTFAVAVSLVLALLPAADGVAHLAHLGGFAAGFVYLKTADWRLRRAERHLRRLSAPGVLLHAAGAGRPGRAGRAGRADQAGGGRTADLGKGSAVERDPAHAEIDRVLDKISERGIDSLTAAERRFLAEMSRRMRDRR
jgi:membrane associated rhomboid family serine protease